jgi:hypothetical protein
MGVADYFGVASFFAGARLSSPLPADARLLRRAEIVWSSLYRAKVANGKKHPGCGAMLP